jgi:uncharacterized protein (DUF1697 family)
VTKYVALLRGITPSNPSMRNENLRAVFRDLGWEEVESVISSGNIIFKARSRKTSELEATVEKALKNKLDIRSTAIIYSKDDLQSLVHENPFINVEDTPQCKLNVTFLKNRLELKFKFPYHPDNRGFIVLGAHKRAIYSVVNLSQGKTPDLMRWVEKEFGNQLTTRTWKTVQRILNKLHD